METYNRIDKHSMAVRNRQNVMHCIANNGPISRSDIARRVGLSLPAVMEITDEFIEHGMVVARMQQQTRKGRRPELLSISGSRFRFIGVDVGRTTIRIALTGIDHRVIDTTKFATPTRVHPARAFIERICAEISALVARAGVNPETIVGIGVAMPGLIERGTGRVIFSPNFDWEDVPLQAWMNELLPYETIVENANRVQAIHEVFRNVENETLTILCVGLGYGIGGGFLQSGELYYGASGTSGEIGHFLVSENSKVRCSCGNVGCLESLASGAALARRAREAVREERSPVLRRLCGGDLDALEARTVFEAAREGDAAAQEIIDSSAEYIGIALATSINLLDPDRIYLCGGMMRNDPEFLEKIRACTLRRQMHSAGRAVTILPGDPDEWNVARSAARAIPISRWRKESLAFMR